MKKEKSVLPEKGLNALVWKEGKIFVARAVEIELASQGKSKEEAIENLKEAIHLYFDDKDSPVNKIKPLNNIELLRVRGNFHYA